MNEDGGKENPPADLQRRIDKAVAKAMERYERERNERSPASQNVGTRSATDAPQGKCSIGLGLG